MEGETTLMLIYLSPLFTRWNGINTESFMPSPFNEKNLTILNKAKDAFVISSIY